MENKNVNNKNNKQDNDKNVEDSIRYLKSELMIHNVITEKKMIVLKQ